ncbi:MAG: VWA domain-containing protein [Bdellovibrionota bacterium]
MEKAIGCFKEITDDYQETKTSYRLMFINIIFKFVLLAIVCALLGCQQAQESSPRREYQLEIKIAYSGNTKSLLSDVVKEVVGSIDSKNPVSIKYSKIDGFSDAIRFGNGEIKVDAWLSPSSTLIETVNQNVSGLGSEVLDCQSVFASPILLALDQANSKILSAEENKISLWKFTEALKSKKVWMASPDPNISAAGLLNLFQFNEVFGNDQFQNNLELIQAASWSNSTDAKHVFLTSTKQPKKIPVVFTSEQEYLQYGSDNMQAYYIKEASAWLNFGFCISNTKNINPDKLAILKSLQKKLLTSKWQTKVKNLGFRPIINVPAAEIFSTNKGIDLSLPNNSLKSPNTLTAKRLLKVWNDTSRAAATAILLDTSSSMEGERLSESAGFITGLATRLLENKGRLSLIRFSNQMDQNTPFVDSLTYLEQRLKTIRPIGGSALHDTIKRAYDLINVEELNKYKKQIIFITDGSDSSSQTKVSDLKRLIVDNQNTEPLSMIGIFITDSQAVPSDTAKLLEDLGGKVIATKLEKLPALIDEVLETL